MTDGVVITGGGKGIGLTIAKKYIKEKYFVIVIGKTKIDKKLINEKKIIFIKGDASKESTYEKIKPILKKNKIQLKIFINNVGISEWKPIEKIDEVFFNKLINNNLKSYFFGSKFAAKNLSKNGVIINISSIAGKRGSKNNSLYSATKFAINGLTQSLSKELGLYGIRVNSICPVLIKTPGLVKALKSKYSPAEKNNINHFLNDFIKNNSALNRLPTTKEVADVCFFLSSNQASAITGQNINVDCGVFPQ